MFSKAQLRKPLRQTRLEMPVAEFAARSEHIVTRLQGLIEQADPGLVHCYEPVVRLHEVDISPLIGYLQDSRPEITLHTSRYIDNAWRVVTFDGDLVTTPAQYDCIIIPMLGFDPHSLHRLGNGGGYYDRFLSTQSSARKIGVCFELGKVNELPNGPHDVPLDVVVTEVGIYEAQLL